MKPSEFRSIPATIAPDLASTIATLNCSYAGCEMLDAVIVQMADVMGIPVASVASYLEHRAAQLRDVDTRSTEPSPRAYGDLGYPEVDR